MDLQLNGKRALVTGSIGAAIARRLATEGVALAIYGRDGTRSGHVAGVIKAGGNAIVTSRDLTGPQLPGKQLPS